jgi:hypothetical protein
MRRSLSSQHPVHGATNQIATTRRRYQAQCCDNHETRSRRVPDSSFSRRTGAGRPQGGPGEPNREQEHSKDDAHYHYHTPNADVARNRLTLVPVYRGTASGRPHRLRLRSTLLICRQSIVRGSIGSERQTCSARSDFPENLRRAARGCRAASACREGAGHGGALADDGGDGDRAAVQLDERAHQR